MGHGMFTAHLAHWRDMEPTCKLCEEGDQTTWHLFSECPALKLAQRTMPENEIWEVEIINYFSHKGIVTLMKENEDFLT